MTNYINYINTQTQESQTQLILKKKIKCHSCLSCHNIAATSSQYSTNVTHAAKSFGIKKVAR